MNLTAGHDETEIGCCAEVLTNLDEAYDSVRRTDLDLAGSQIPPTASGTTPSTGTHNCLNPTLSFHF